MAEKEIVAQIDKLRKTRPARVIETMQTHYGNDGGVAPMLAHDLTIALTFLLLDLKDEARLVEQAKIKGGMSIMKDRLAVAGWLELFVVQLGREPGAPPVEREPAPDRTEPVTSHEALNEFVSDMAAQGRGELLAGDKRCAAKGINHDVHTWLGPKDQTTGSSRWRCWGGNSASVEQVACDGVKLASVTVFPPSPEKVTDGKAITDYLSGVSDELDALALGDTQVQSVELDSATPYCFRCDTCSHLCPGCGDVVDHNEMACKACRVLAGDAAGIDLVKHDASMSITRHTSNGTPYTVSGAADVIERLGLSTDEQATHDAIDKEYAHVTADPFVHGDPDLRIDPFAPIPRTVWAPAVPPNGAAWTSADLLAPVDAAFLPAHLSFSQVTTVGDCGAKYRMQRIAQIPQVPQWANIGGTTFHTCVQTIEESGNEQALTDRPALDSLWNTTLENEIQMIEQASGMTREQFRASAQGREGYDWWRVEGAAMLQRYVDWRQGAGAGQAVLQGPTARPMLEWETTYNVDGVPFKTILDSVWTDSTQGGMVQGRTAIIRDWKTGSMKPDNRQLCTQAWGLRMAGWEGNVLVQFFDARKGTFSEPFDPFGELGMTWDDVRYFVLSADAQRRLPILPARPSDFCGGCSVAYACPIMSQRKAPKAATK